MFERGILDLPNPIYRAWVVLKLAAVGSPQESFDFVLQKRVPKNLPRPKPKIKRIQPDGEQRYHMQSKGWMDILESREATVTTPRELQLPTSAASPKLQQVWHHPPSTSNQDPGRP